MKHNTLLHYDIKESSSRCGQDHNAQSEALGTSFNALAYKAHNALVSAQFLLSTAVINVKGKDGKLMQARILLHSGAQSNFITERFAKSLELPRNHIDIQVETFNQVETGVKHSIQTEILSRCTGYKEQIDFLILPNICNQLPNEYVDKRSINVPSRKPLADFEFNKPKQINALIGIELFFHLLCVGQEKIPGSTALWQKTNLGWILAGKIHAPDQSVKPTNCILAFNSLHRSITKFWEIEEIQNQKVFSEEEFRVEQHFRNKYTFTRMRRNINSYGGARTSMMF